MCANQSCYSLGDTTRATRLSRGRWAETGAAGGTPKADGAAGWNHLENSASADPRVTERAMRAAPSKGASMAMTRAQDRQQESQSDGRTPAGTANPVMIIKTTCGSQTLYKGQLKSPMPRFGQDAGGEGRLPLPPATR